MDIEFGTSVVDKDGRPIGNVEKIFMDTWTGTPRKYMVRREEEGPDTMYFFSPGQVGEAAPGSVKLNVSVEELEKA
ncbi:MAG: hypothetical protein A2Z29_11455 [Chloroflexi bacterium RBG_16_56_11]|nr:MAG: hypothetical protein A2Z29_11455 [Chloroflexi bacterium RBG_16_56_11]